MTDTLQLAEALHAALADVATRLAAIERSRTLGPAIDVRLVDQRPTNCPHCGGVIQPEVTLQ